MKKKKLKLDKNTLRALSGASLGSIAGGAVVVGQPEDPEPPRPTNSPECNATSDGCRDTNYEGCSPDTWADCIDECPPDPEPPIGPDECPDTALAC